MVTLPELLDAARSDAEDAAQRYLLDRSTIPFAFDVSSHNAFRQDAATRLSVLTDDLVVVGSARLGFSTSPFHLGRAFGTSSDIDLVVVSADLFDLAWDHIAMVYPCIGYSSSVRAAYDKHRQTGAVRGWIYPDAFPGLVPFQPSWFDGLQRLTMTSPGRRTVKARLYRTWRHALHYYRWSLEECIRRGGNM